MESIGRMEIYGNFGSAWKFMEIIEIDKNYRKVWKLMEVMKKRKLWEIMEIDGYL